MSTTRVNPGDIASFATFVGELLDGWTGADGAAIQLAHGQVDAPQFGSFAAATTTSSTYEPRLDAMRTAFGQLQRMLHDVEQTSRKIAQNYKNAEELAKATVADVSSALAEAMSDDADGNGGNSAAA